MEKLLPARTNSTKPPQAARAIGAAKRPLGQKSSILTSGASKGYAFGRSISKPSHGVAFEGNRAAAPARPPVDPMDAKLKIFIDWFAKCDDATKLRCFNGLLANCTEHLLQLLKPKLALRLFELNPLLLEDVREDPTKILPPCLCLRIFAHLDPRSLSRAAQVSSFWKYLAEANSLWCQKCQRFGWVPNSRQATPQYKKCFIENVVALRSGNNSAITNGRLMRNAKNNVAFKNDARGAFGSQLPANGRMVPPARRTLSTAGSLSGDTTASWKWPKDSMRNPLATAAGVRLRKANSVMDVAQEQPQRPVSTPKMNLATLLRRHSVTESLRTDRGQLPGRPSSRYSNVSSKVYESRPPSRPSTAASMSDLASVNTKASSLGGATKAKLKQHQPALLKKQPPGTAEATAQALKTFQPIRKRAPSTKQVVAARPERAKAKSMTLPIADISLRHMPDGEERPAAPAIISQNKAPFAKKGSTQLMPHSLAMSDMPAPTKSSANGPKPVISRSESVEAKQRATLRETKPEIVADVRSLLSDSNSKPWQGSGWDIVSDSDESS